MKQIALGLERRGFLRLTPDPADHRATEVDRHRDAGPKVRWRGECPEWRRHENGIVAPARAVVRWLDDPESWFDMRTERLPVDVPIDDALGWARTELAKARQR